MWPCLCSLASIVIDCSCSFNVFVRLIDGIVSIKNTTLHSNNLFSCTVKNTSCWRMLETQSFLNTVLPVVEWEATDGAACSAALHTPMKSTFCIMHILVKLIFFCHATIYWALGKVNGLIQTKIKFSWQLLAVSLHKTPLRVFERFGW